MSNTEKIEEQIKTQYTKAFFDMILEDLSQEPSKLDHITSLVKELVDGLCKFIPSRKEAHEKIKEEILLEVNINNMPYIIFGLINWIEKFQAPAYDKVTRKWREEFKSCTNYNEFIVKFLREYYEHAEKMYKELWEARKRLLNNENIVPPEHRPVVKGKNGIPDVMKSGR